ncbi:predicted protein [Chaetoceros tenuissimus]|uniref:Uncharacterized protein n=1 Tax=Chaetoceros tenuissimus TaxID=426638 RepID=A0AAD3CWP2_9STRA|nr:predicted protein [Chaetoceros tenuissimus]
MVHMKMGKEIGQIIHFDSYEDMSISKFKELSKKIKCFAPKQYRELVNDLNNSNVPQQSSAEMKVLICFVDTETMSGFYFDSNSVALNGFGKSASLKKRYKKDADECFSQLQVLVKFMPQNIVEKVSL